MPEVVASELVLHRGGREALAASTFTIPNGVITAVIGPNGSGKSTLLHAIAGLLEPTAGSIHVDGCDPEDVRERISYVLQSTQVNDAIPVTVREAVLMARFSGTGWLGRLSSDDRAVVSRALERLDLTSISGRHLRELSGGQRQRAFVAQGLAQDHDLLLLDEPLTGLDAPSAQVIDDVVHEEQASGHSVILTTHDLAEAAAADHVVLVGGRVIASGPPDEVLTERNLAEAYGNGHHHGGPGPFLDDPAHLTEERHSHRSFEG
ncbi:MAG: metal ABC transporter ATP-binding protein [Acidimicrobiia bacterium]|jgi:manganese transport system ATP-binding protein|nr:MAG: metal ABC transporter ATP-binding protein [Acidimicrobiia bacterium]